VPHLQALVQDHGRHGADHWPKDDPGDRRRPHHRGFLMHRTFRCDPIEVSEWKRQFLDGASELFTRGKKTKDKDEEQVKESELFQQYCYAEA